MTTNNSGGGRGGDRERESHAGGIKPSASTTSAGGGGGGIGGGGGGMGSLSGVGDSRSVGSGGGGVGNIGIVGSGVGTAGIIAGGAGSSNSSSSNVGSGGGGIGSGISSAAAGKSGSSGGAGGKAGRVIRRHRSHTDARGAVTGSIFGRYRDDTMEMEGLLPTPVRDRLYELFGQIEKEFEQLYASNQALQDRVEVLTERLAVDTSSIDKPILLETQDPAEYASKNKKSQLSQKIKTTYKQSTSKLVSSFRTSTAVYSLVREFRGHRDGVWEVSVSRSQPTPIIGTASADHSARLYSVDTGTCVLRYLGHHGSVNSIRFHPTQDLVLTASGDGTAHIWKAQVSSHPSYSDVQKSQSSGDEELDSSEREDGQDSEVPEVPPVDSNNLYSPHLELKQHSEVVTAADWMCGGSQVITASWDRMAVLADGETGELISLLSGHDQELTDVHAHQTQRLALTSSKDTTFRLWDFRASAMTVNVFQGHTQQVTSAVFASGDKIVSGSDDRTVKVWDMRNMRSATAAIRTDSEVNRLSVSHSHNVIAIPHDNRNIRLYDTHGVRIGRLPRNNRQGHARMVCAVSWSEHSNANTVCNLFSCGFDRQVLGWMVNLQGKE